ncbi:MAG: 16S rRNA (cytidine(1402)-2'-O)-methyltransferase [Bacteriovorax sp.]|nr:16S rRNA (cytidine(1402)-2'-O)-methyltransferase [Bacteriovorax sp.]
MSSLTLITLPIGNIKDITFRAVEALKSGEYFYAEDTRVFKNLLGALEIEINGKHIDSFHEHSEGKIKIITEKIKNGTTVYLVSDAGSPMISDPAFPLLKKMREEGIDIKTIPGVTSVVTALELSGLPPQPFHFWGFISRSKNERKDFFLELALIPGTHIFFESPHRIYETIDSFFGALPLGELVITRELTKTFESIYRINQNNYQEKREQIVDKGEFVALFHVENLKHSPVINSEITELVRDYLDVKGGTKKLAKIFAKLLGEDTKKIYDQLSRSDKE